MGPIGYMWNDKPMAQMTHVTFLSAGGSWTEFCRNIGQLPARGAYFISLSAKVVDMSGGLIATSKENTVTADQGTYFVDTEQIILTGKKVVISQGDNVAVGTKLVANLKTTTLHACKHK